MTDPDHRLRATLRRFAGRVEQAPMLIAAVKVPLSYRRTLLPRSTLDQGLVTGVSMALDYTLGAMAQDGIEVLASRLLGRPPSDQPDDLRWRRAMLVGDLAAMGVGVGAQLALRQQPGERPERAIARTTGYWLASTGLASAAITALHQALGAADQPDGHDEEPGPLPIALPAAGMLAGLYELRSRRHSARIGESDDEGWRVSVLPSLGVGAAVSLALRGIAAAERASAVAIGRRVGQVLPGHARLARPLGHAGALLIIGTGVAAGVRRGIKRIESDAELPEPPFDLPPTSELVSGGPGSLVSFDTLSRQGRRNVSTVLRSDWISTVMDEPAVASPIRVYVGWDSAPTDEASVRLALQEMERTGAFDRSLLMVIAPTGTGYINHIAVESAEYLSRGDIASVAVQYAKRPSVLSLNRRGAGSRRLRMLIDGIIARIRALPPARRPRVVLFGESLGAWIGQDVFMDTGTDGLAERGIDHALWIGTPFASKWKQQILHSSGPHIDRGRVGHFDHFDQVEALSSAERARLRYFMVTHNDDPVAHWGIDLLVRSPSWPNVVTPSSRGSVARQWVTPHTFMEALIDLKNASKVVPGLFEAKGHDYRGDLLHFVSEAYRLPADERQLTRVEAALRRNEVLRKLWIDARAIVHLDVPE